MDAGVRVASLFLSLSLLVFYSVSFCRSESCDSRNTLRTYNCTARQCLKCGTETTRVLNGRNVSEVLRHPASCSYDANTTTLHCVPDTSSCSVQMCESCQHCVAEYHKLPGVKLTGEWEFTSHCINLERHYQSPDCESNNIFYPDRCVGTYEIEPYRQAGILSGQMELFGVDCGCYETYCVNGSGEIKLNFLEQPTNTPVVTSESIDGGTGTEDGNVTLSSPNNSSGRLADVFIVIIAISLVIVGVVVTVLVLCLVTTVRKKLHSSTSDRIRPQAGHVRPDEPQNDQPWTLIGRIGQGRYGYVYKAQYRGDIVAVKIFSHNCRTAWETECTMNSMESTAHKNVVEFITSESRGSGISLQLFIITRYYPLGSLNQFLRNHVVKLEQACEMIKDIAEGLAHLHAEYYTNSSGIMAEKYAVAHRDIKSANVLVKHENGECVIGDLGFAMILDPSLDSKQLASTGQVGTFRYMAPEVLDTRVHLQDLQSFKQIDIYAFALIMWEVLSRCCVYGDEDVPPYQLPYEDMVGLRPSLDVMKELVVARKLRPSLSSTWENDERLSDLHETVVECWDEDPEARLSAANIVYRMEEFFKTSLNLNEEKQQPSGTTTHYQPNNTMVTYNRDMTIGQPMECSQSSPPPCYSPTDPNSIQNSGEEGTQRQYFFPTSMPHINQGSSGCGTGSGCGSAGYSRAPLGLRNSACSEGESVRMNVYNSHQPLSVRNSLILGGNERKGEAETNFGASAVGGASLLFERVLEIQGENDGSSVGNALSNNGSVAGLDVDEFNLNSDSGVQNIHSSSATSMSSESNSSSSESLNTVSSSRLSDELFSKRQLPESSTDTLDLDGPTNAGDAPTLTTTNELGSAAVSLYGDVPTFPTTNELGSAAVSRYGDVPTFPTTNQLGSAAVSRYTLTTTNELPLVVPAESSGNSIATVTSV